MTLNFSKKRRGANSFVTTISDISYQKRVMWEGKIWHFEQPPLLIERDTMIIIVNIDQKGK